MSGAGARSLDAGLAALADVGRAPTGGYARFAWTDADLTLRAWFRSEAEARGLDVVADRAGNLWAWWGDPDRDGPGVVTGSHLDSVPGGGALDGPLGVVSAFAAVDVLRERGLTPRRPLGVACFSDEEGARFGVACLGSRVLTGALAPDRALGLRDDGGRSLADVLGRLGSPGSGGTADGGVPAPGTYGADPEALARVGTFVELHVEQGRLLSDHNESAGTDLPVATGSGIWPHGRWRVDLPGRPNHAGTTPLRARRDPMLDLAALVQAVRAAASDADALATVGKVLVEPNGVNAIPSRVTAWVDARADEEAAVRAVLAGLAPFAPQRESWTPATMFDARLAMRVARVAGEALGGEERAGATGGTPPVVPLIGTGAGHDAGILSAAGVPTAMLYVRNPTGVSHAPDEHAERDDCVAGVEALAAVLADLTGASPDRAPRSTAPAGEDGPR